mmetsp:Transcript_27350/g.40445  ORF Transcript_27350/g.40445 Transcript_27350/m.40445 type:complete len:542 (-) Transcript_27350:304-1929(-)|eukprot:CAMPEP_0195519290 /NCGR_PEP_ID=MMETSP0794_2-20130614/14560_1 /TAXON_ID=515487 /ORGANISM="Stephanopyxis turris, Strain CCMP 815" /LENGTH=541 /DNA_ID=CAMNT_0040648415 /DNA_START=606 /DNA_END=2231 /DNA_ORIENTATION=-
MASQNELKRRLNALMKRPENQVCADCPERQPRWASLIVAPPGSPPGALKFGAFCCLECSGSHRRLGVHISFVRSVNLDSWKESEVIAMEMGGNANVNAIFEGRDPGNAKPSAGADGRTRERFIRDKYERRKYFDASALSKVYSKNPEDSDDDEESEEEEPVSSSSSRNKVPVPKIRTPSDAAKKRAETRRGRLGKTRATVDNNKVAKATAQKEKAQAEAAAAQAASTTVDLLDFGTGPTQVDPGPPPAPPSATPSPTLDMFGNLASQSNRQHQPASDPFAVDTNNNVAEAPATSQQNQQQVPSVQEAVQEQKPKLNSDQIMSMFNTPVQGGANFAMMGNVNPAMGMNNMNSMQAMMNQMNMGGNTIPTMQQQQPNNMGGGNNSMMMMQANNMSGGTNPMMMMQANNMGRGTNPMMQQQPNSMAGMMMQQPMGGNNMMRNSNQMRMMMTQPNMNTTNGMQQNMNTNGMQQKNNVNMMMMQQQNYGMNPEQFAQQQQSGLNMGHIAMMNRMQMGNAISVPGSTQNQNQQQQGQQQMNQFGLRN